MPGIYERDQADMLKLQEVGDTIYIAESTKTPFTRLLPRGTKPKQGLSEWPVQLYEDKGFEGTMDGHDISTFSHSEREKLRGYWMWLMTDGWMASRLANLTRTAGVKNSERAKQAADDAIKLAFMHEKQLLSAVDTQAEAAPATPYRSRGVYSWIQTAAQSTLPVPANFRPASGCAYTSALGSFMPSNMETMLEAAADAKKGPVSLVAYCGIKLKRQMSTWTQRQSDDTGVEIVRTIQSAADKKLQQVVDFFEFDAGEYKAVPTWHQLCTEGTGAASNYTTRSGAWLDMSMWELRFADAPAAYVCPPKSGGPRGYHDTVFILVCKNPLGQCYVYTNTDS